MGGLLKQATLVIERVLEQRFGKIDAQALVFGRARLVSKDIQFIDVKHMSELCDRYRLKLRQEIAAYRAWAMEQKIEADPVSRLYAAAEGASLHRRISDGLKLWYFAHRDYHAMRRAYLIKCMGPMAQVDWLRARGSR